MASDPMGAERERPVRFIDLPAAVSLALQKAARNDAENAPPRVREDASGPDESSPDAPSPGVPSPEASSRDALDLLASAAGYEDGEIFWNGLIEQHGGSGQEALSVFASIEIAMTEARTQEGLSPQSPDELSRNNRREAFMRTNIRAALKEFEGKIAVVTGAWHISGLRQSVKPADDRALLKDLPRVKVEATWVPYGQEPTTGRTSGRHCAVSLGFRISSS
jgi:hypothetical protein